MHSLCISKSVFVRKSVQKQQFEELLTNSYLNFNFKVFLFQGAIRKVTQASPFNKTYVVYLGKLYAWPVQDIMLSRRREPRQGLH